jgi:hypothetical protein
MRVPVRVAKGAGLAAVGLALAGAGGPAAGGARSPAASSSRAARGQRRQLDPAQLAALEIIRLQPVVPFSPAQVQQLVPILQSLAANPNLPADQLSAKAQQIEAVFTATQKQALQNMGSQTGAFPGGGFGRSGAGAGPGGTFVRRRPASGSASGPQAGGVGPAGAASGSGSNGRGPGRLGAGGVYQLAIATLQGQATPGSGGFFATGSGASSAAGAGGGGA